VPVSAFSPSTPAGSFFGSTNYGSSESLTGAIGKQTTQMQNSGLDLMQMGQQGLHPVFQKLLQLLSGDENAVNEAVLPQTRGVLDQYDTARKAIAQFTPRGGGQASALTKSRFDASSDIAGIKSKAISSAIGELSQLGTQLLSVGTEQQKVSLGSMFNLLESAKQDEHATREMWGKIGIVAGRLAAAYFTSGASEIAFAAANE